jgi:hypothetical protein
MMKSISLVVVGACLFLGATAGSALAKSDVGSGATSIVPLPRASQLADNVVVTPQGGTAPAAVPVQPAPVAPVVAQPVETAPRRTTVVEQEPHNYMSTIAVSALMGAVAGVLIGGSIYYLGDQQHAARIGYWAAGGVLVGTGVGLVQLAVQESRADAAVSTRFPSDPAPTYRLALLNLRF